MTNETQHQHRRDEQRDLGARADRDVDREVHLVLARDEDRDPVLGGVADDRDHDRADEELAQADRLARPRRSSRRGSRTCTPTATPGDRQHDRPTGARVHGSSRAPRRSWSGLKRSRWVRSEKIRPADVGDDQDDRDGAARGARPSSRSRRAPSPGLRQAVAVDELEDRRHHHRGRGQQQHRRLRPGRGAVEALAVAAQPADEHRGAQDEQDVADDRADERGLDDLLQPLVAARRGR